MLVCAILSTLARETAGAACTRLSLRPLFKRGRNDKQNSGKSCRENEAVCPASLRAKRSNPFLHICGAMDCLVRFAPRNDDVDVGPRNTFGVVLAKARTHYPKCLLLHDAGAAIPLTMECSGYNRGLGRA